jgi:hypothetical protein
MLIIATWVIAVATVVNLIVTGANVYVAWLSWRRTGEQLERTDKGLELTREQMALTREQIAHSREMFVESNRPRLEVQLTNCIYDEDKQELSFKVVVCNRGASAARKVSVFVYSIAFFEALTCVIQGVDIERDSTHTVTHFGPLKRPAWQASPDWPVITEVACSYVGMDEHSYGFKERHRWSRLDAAFVRYEVRERTG